MEALFTACTFDEELLCMDKMRCPQVHWWNTGRLIWNRANSKKAEGDARRIPLIRVDAGDRLVVIV